MTLQVLRKYPLLYNLIQKFLSFSFVGLIVTIISLCLTYLFLKILGTHLYPTYILIYCFMILLSYALNLKFTFKSEHKMKKLLYYFLVYLSGMVIGIIVLKIYELTLPFENWILSYLVVPVTAVWNFVFSSKILMKVNKHE